jgi:hypothetical protein
MKTSRILLRLIAIVAASLLCTQCVKHDPLPPPGYN